MNDILTPDQLVGFEGIFNQIKDIEGWMGPKDCQVLYKYASRVKGTIVETGAYKGRSAALMKLTSPESRVITIDNKVTPLLIKASQDYDFTVINGISWDVAQGWDKGKIDLLFIDGDHGFEGVVSDIVCFLPHLEDDAWILLHDYNTAESEGDYAVRRVLERLKLINLVSVESGIACCQKI